MSFIKQLFASLTVFTILISMFPSSLFANKNETYFIITAYYSPLPGQIKYFQGSYAKEIRMNGKGTNGASGKEVFEGMLAAPKKYPFGTKIHFEGYGVAEVQDRGGAIVSAGNRGNSYDRIDIWMGFGDEGRERAVQWGRQTVKGKLISNDAENTLKFDDQSSVSFVSLRVGPGSNEAQVKRMQELFQKANLYSGKIDGKYESIEEALLLFQIEKNIIQSLDDEAAGYFGPQTIQALSSLLSIPKTTLIEEDLAVFYGSKGIELSEFHKILLKYGDLRAGPESSSSTITKLQELMRELGKYSGELNGDYNSVFDSLVAFQIELGLVENEKSWGAGYFGNKTRSALWEFYEDPENKKPVETIIERIEEIDSDYILSAQEKTDIKKAISLIKKRLKSIELQGGAKMNATLERLFLQIQAITPQIRDQKILAKLLFIQGEIR